MGWWDEVQNEMSDGSWKCWAPLTMASLGTSCLFYQGERYGDAVVDNQIAEQQLLEEQNRTDTLLERQAQLVVQGSMAEVERENAATQLQTILLTMLPVVGTIALVGTGVLGYMWWRRGN